MGTVRGLNPDGTVPPTTLAELDQRYQRTGGEVLLPSPDGTLHRLVVADDGTLSTTPA